MRFTKQARQKIAEEFAIRHNGHYNPVLFVEEVRAMGAGHPAYAWFEWNTERAALAYQVTQARAFVQGIRISFSVEVVGKDRSVVVRETEMPFMLSPLAGRRIGGGYAMTNPDNPDLGELCLQGAQSLQAWLVRYRAAVDSVGSEAVRIERLIRALEAAGATEEEDAA